MWIAFGKYLFPAEHWLNKLRSMKTKASLGLFGTVCVCFCRYICQTTRGLGVILTNSFPFLNSSASGCFFGYERRQDSFRRFNAIQFKLSQKPQLRAPLPWSKMNTWWTSWQLYSKLVKLTVKMDKTNTGVMNSINPRANGKTVVITEPVYHIVTLESIWNWCQQCD